jgi:hypothetical protein
MNIWFRFEERQQSSLELNVGWIDENILGWKGELKRLNIG